MNEWMPGAERVAGAHAGGALIGGPPRCTWHITWDHLDPRPTFDGVRDFLVRVNYEPTLMWDPETGRFAQFVPASRSAYAVKNLAGGVETNRMGDVHVQVEVFFSPGYKDRKLFTDGPLVGLEQLMAWLDELGVPRVAVGDWSHPNRDLTIWRTHPGHYGHFQVPENDHSDPIVGTDIARILAAGQQPPEEDMPPAPATAAGMTFVRGTDAALWVCGDPALENGSWAKLGGKLTSGPGAAERPDGSVVVVVRGEQSDDKQFHTYEIVRSPDTVDDKGSVVYGKWGGWKNLGGNS